jgi:leucyl/phenylalanyl-tRNA--protein transferase
MHISRRLRRTLRSGKFHLTINRDFAGVIRGCAHRPGEGTWIIPDMLAAYEELHELGHAHSVEAWHDGKLSGGVYGVAIGGFFAAESMFTRVRDGSKVALAHLMSRLKQRGFLLCDIQFLSDHTSSLGGSEISRADYLKRLRKALAVKTEFM